ncbi:putative cyclic bacteriocin [Staphylococcus aureus]
MLKLHKKIAWTGIKGSAITTFITALYNGSSVWNALAVAGIAFGGWCWYCGCSSCRATVMRFIKRWAYEISCLVKDNLILYKERLSFLGKASF